MTQREQLIEDAAKAAFTVEHPGVEWWGVADVVKRRWIAQQTAALAVFEGVHTPTDDERAKVVAELRWLADAREAYKTDTFPEIAMQVHTARLLGDILERKTPVAEGGQGFGWIPSWMWDQWDQMAAHRTPQGEPSDAQIEAACLAYAADEMTREEWEWLKTQPESFQPYWDGMKAALIAAAETGGER